MDEATLKGAGESGSAIFSGVFSDISSQTFLTTVVPLFIIAVIFLWYMVWLAWLAYVTWRKLGTDVRLDSLASTWLSDIAGQYRDTIQIKTPDGDKTNYPASEYFSSDSVSWAYHINLRALSSAPGMFVGLGLLGTFVGLMIGIQDFQAANSEEVMASIKKLLPGMWMAFSTSVAGMLCSILFSVPYRWVSNWFRKKLQRFAETLDKAYYVDDASLLSGVIREQLECKKEDGTTVPLGQAVREILTENGEQSKALKSFSTDLAESMSGLLDDVLSMQVEDKIQPLLQNLADHLDELAKKVQAPASDMVGAVVDDLKKSMAQVIDEFRKGLSGSATTELENLVKQLGATSDAMTALPKDMENISSTLQVVIQDV